MFFLGILPKALYPKSPLDEMKTESILIIAISYVASVISYYVCAKASDIIPLADVLSG
jgi:hypothetical protein